MRFALPVAGESAVLQRIALGGSATIGAHLLGTLDDAWADYVVFHLETVQCGICRANLEDLENASKSEVSRDWRHRVLQ